MYRHLFAILDDVGPVSLLGHIQALSLKLHNPTHEVILIPRIERIEDAKHRRIPTSALTLLVHIRPVEPVEDPQVAWVRRDIDLPMFFRNDTDGDSHLLKNIEDRLFAFYIDAECRFAELILL